MMRGFCERLGTKQITCSTHVLYTYTGTWYNTEAKIWWRRPNSLLPKKLASQSSSGFTLRNNAERSEAIKYLDLFSINVQLHPLQHLAISFWSRTHCTYTLEKWIFKLWNIDTSLFSEPQRNIFLFWGLGVPWLWWDGQKYILTIFTSESKYQ